MLFYSYFQLCITFFMQPFPYIEEYIYFILQIKYMNLKASKSQETQKGHFRKTKIIEIREQIRDHQAELKNKNKATKPTQNVLYKLKKTKKEKVKRSLEELMILAAEKIYGIKVESWMKMGGKSQEFSLWIKTKCPKNNFFVKVSPPQKKLSRLVEQTQILAYLRNNHQNVKYPQTYKSIKGNLIPRYLVRNRFYRFRLMEWIQGVQLGKITKLSKQALRRIGRVLGEMENYLRKYPKQIQSQRKDILGLQNIKRAFSCGKRSMQGEWKFFNEYNRKFLRTVQKRPKCVIHGDAHPFNIMAHQSGEIVGILDFGSTRMSHPGFDLGVLITHLVTNKNISSLVQIIEVARGFHQVHPFSKQQLSFFYHFLCPRLIHYLPHLSPKVKKMLSIQNRYKLNKAIKESLLFVNKA